MNGKKILVVEDSPTQGESLRSALDEMGFQVDLVTSGEAALERIAATAGPPFDLVVSDVVMPGINGFELCRRIKARDDSDMPVVLLTSLADPMAIVRGLECGADNYVTKPYTLPHLMARIRHALDKHTLRSDSRSSMGVKVRFLDTSFTITSGKEQILDLFISSIEDVVRMNDALVASQREVAKMQAQLEEFAASMARRAQISAEKYSALMQSAHDAILVLELDGTIAEANAQASELLGKRGVLLGRKLQEFGADTSRGKLSELLDSLARARRVSEPDVAFAGASGDLVYCDVSGSRTGEDSGDLFLVILHDVTERRINEEGLRRSRQQLAEAQSIAGMGSWEWDFVSNRLSCSDEVYRIMGVSPDALIPSYEWILGRVHEEDRLPLVEAVRNSISESRPFSVEVRLLRPDKSVRYLHSRGETRRSSTGDPVAFIGTTIDITERKELEQQFRQAQKMEAVGLLAGGVAHDFNNLLTVIQGNSDLALESLDPSDPAHNHITDVRRAAASAAAVTQQLLAFSRRQVFQPRPMQLPTAVLDIGRLVGRLLGENIELVLDIPGDGGLVLADAGQIEQVLINLTVNARDAMPEGGRITIANASMNACDPRLREAQLPPGDYEVLSVTDTGIGMDEATQERIFEPFFTTKPEGTGTGLGLSTVHGIVMQSGAQLRVASRPGEGTVFTIYFPRVAGEMSVVTDEPATTAVGGSETILVVEDEALLRKLARRVLSGMGYAVVDAENAGDAIRVANAVTTKLDLLLTDVVMPGMSVPQMVRQITGRNPGMKVVFMSGYHNDHAMLQDLGGTSIDFLQKPFSPDDLSRKVREVLDRG